MITLKNITKDFPSTPGGNTLLRLLRVLKQPEMKDRSVPVLKDVSFQVERGQRIALIGENGSGKTTLLRIICGIYQADKGTLTVNGRIRALFDYRVGYYEYLPVLDNIYVIGAIHGLERRVLKPLIDEMLATCEISHLRCAELRELSSGQQQRLTMSVFMRAEGDIYIFDETFAHIDQAFASKIERFMERLTAEGKTIVMTSHSTKILSRYCTEAIWLDAGRIREYDKVDVVLGSYKSHLRSIEGQSYE
jgi:lipopolysaccharide transport system ATP-binding protein